MDVEKYLQANGWITNEILAAEEKHPHWPKDVIHQAAIVAEEAGELVQAALQYHYEGGSPDRVRKEAIQTGAMAHRLLMHMLDWKEADHVDRQT